MGFIWGLYRVVLGFSGLYLGVYIGLIRGFIGLRISKVESLGF